MAELFPCKRIALLVLLSMFAWSGSQAQFTQWAVCRNLPGPRFMPAAASWPYPNFSSNFLREVYVFGGHDGILATNTSWKIDGSQLVSPYFPPFPAWTALAPMPTARLGHEAIAMNDDLIYVLGGISISGQYLGTLEIYNPATNTWSTGSPMPTPRSNFALATDGSRLYAIGGTNGSAVFSTVEIYDPLTNAWTTGSPMPTARAYIQPAIFNSFNANPVQFLVMGGSTSSSGVVSASETYFPATNTWSINPPMAYPRRAYSVTRFCMFAGFLSGGTDLGGQSSSEIYLLGGTSGMVPYATHGIGARVGHQLLTFTQPYTGGFVSIGGLGGSPLDSVHSHLTFMVLADADIEPRATRRSGDVLLQAELPADHAWTHYQWERSADGESFTVLQEAMPIQSGSLADQDDLPMPGQSYYRLALRSLDGELSHSKVVELSPLQDAAPIISPNPFTDQLSISYPGEWNYRLHDCTGRLLGAGSGKDMLSLATSELSSGIYLLTLDSDFGKMVFRIAKQ